MENIKFHDVKMVVSDMDGTFLSSSKSILADNLSAVNRLYESGIIFTIATSRPHQMTQAYAEHLDISVPLICSNGAILFDWGKKYQSAA